MKALIISDIHANIHALRAIEKVETWDTVYCCGDLTDYGPFPMEVIAWMKEHDAHVVCGNHDIHVMTMSDEACAEARRGHVWKWCHDNWEKMDQSAKAYLSALPTVLQFEMDGIEYQMQHQYDQRYGTVESEAQFNAFWKNAKDDHQQRRLLFGHSHRRCIHVLREDMMWINPGSVSYRRPDDPDKRAHYMIIEDGDIRFGAVSYDRSPLLNVAKKYQLRGYMLETELQDAYFFFGDAPTSRSPLPMITEIG